jgi:hypothetical protein
MSDPVDEIKVAAKLVEHEHFMGLCAGGFPLVALKINAASAVLDGTRTASGDMPQRITADD